MNAQNESAIQIPPTLSQGYLLLDQVADIDYWEVEFIVRTYQDESVYTDEVVESIELIGDNYLMIPPEYGINRNAYVRVTQHLTSGIGNIELDKLNMDPCEKPGGGSELGNVWWCNGSTYAWEIQQWYGLSNGNPVNSTFSVKPASASVSSGNPTIVTPYYQYFSPTQFQAFQNSIVGPSGNSYINGVNYTDYYQIGDELVNGTFNGSNSGPGAMIQLVKLNYDPLHLKKDMNGNNITGVQYVYGIAKGLGPWGGSCNVSGASWGTTPVTTYTQSVGVNSIQWAMNLINTDAQSDPNNCLKPDLTCSSAGGTGPSSVGPSWDDYELPSDIIHYHSIDSIIGVLLGTEVPDLWDEYYSIKFTKVSGIKDEIFNLKIADLFDENGDLIDIPINLQKGLYSILIQFSDGDFITLLKEVSDGEDNIPVTDANFLSKTIFPVPIVENSFSISFSATKDLNFEYNLYDFNMNLIYKTKVNIGAGESTTIVINPDVEIPSGILLNKFIFEDNSQSSVLTVK
jgi:hypothetical protein